MSSRNEKMEAFLDELALVVEGDREAMARHADFLVDDDDARDIRHEASGVLARLGDAGADYVPPVDLEARLLAALDARDAESSGRKTDPGFVVDPAAPATSGSSASTSGVTPAPIAPAGTPTTPARADFGATVRANAFAVDAPTTTTTTAATTTAATPTTEDATPSGIAKTVELPAVTASSASVVSLDDARARRIDAPSTASATPSASAGATTSTSTSATKRGPSLARVIALFGGFATIAAAAAAAVITLAPHAPGGLATVDPSITVGTGAGTSITTPTTTRARVTELVRAAGSESGTGLQLQHAGGSFADASVDQVFGPGDTLRTDERTRARVLFDDGSELVLNRGTELSLDATSARSFRLATGEVLADVAHVEGVQAHFLTPTGIVEVVGTKFALSAVDGLSTIRVTRGKVRVATQDPSSVSAGPAVFADVNEGEEGVMRPGRAPEVAPAMDLARAIAWADLGGDRGVAGNVGGEETSIPGLGSLRARRPGEREDRERPLAVASANVRVRISGNVARTEIEQVFQNDSAQELEGIYRFPLPADAQIARLALDVDGVLQEGSFVARNRAQRIWRGVIRNATPVVERRPNEEYIWVPGPWRDPALLEWQRGGNFELRIFPIPANGSRRVVIAYTQTLAPHGSERRYVYPLPVSRDGSTRVGSLDVDVRVLGAHGVRSAGYPLVESTSDGATTLAYEAHDFVPNGDLVIDYAPENAGELAYWAYQGPAAVAPPAQSRDQDREVVDAQRAIAADGRGYVSFALRPNLPARTDGRAHDYVIALDSSQSMVGERFARASRLVAGMLAEMDVRDRFTVLACDDECRAFDARNDFGAPSSNGANNTASNVVAPNGASALHSPTANEVRAVTEWLGRVEPAGASDLARNLADAARIASSSDDRDVYVIYVGDGVASVGLRSTGLLADEAHRIAERRHVSITTVGIGGDADTIALAAIARAGGGHYVPYVPGERASTTALAVLETTYGVSLDDPRVELPTGLVELAPSALPTVRAGEELRFVARVNAPAVQGDVVLRGTVAGEPFEQRYAVDVRPTDTAGNLFVPAQWAASTIADLELAGRGEDEARIIALSKAYSVMSRHTSLLVLESDAMFRAFGVDRAEQPAPQWTGDASAEGVDAEPELAVAGETRSASDADEAGGLGNVGSLGLTGRGFGGAGRGGAGIGHADVLAGGALTTSPAREAAPRAAPSTSTAQADVAAAAPMAPAGESSRARSTAAVGPSAGAGFSPPRDRSGRWMRREWVRVGDVDRTTSISSRDESLAFTAEANLAANPDSRDRHRSAAKALARAGRIERALEVVEAWITRDRLDPEPLTMRADLLARLGRRDEALRVLSGIVDLRPDDLALQERLARTYEREGENDRACAHRVAMAAIDTAQAAPMGAALRCERTLGRSDLADALLASMRDGRARDRALRASQEPAPTPRTRGELQVDATWGGGDELDVALIAPDGTRLSWMGGRTTVVANTPRAAGTESVGLTRALSGTYLIEVSRTARGSLHPVSGQLRVRVLDASETIPFTFVGERAVVGRATVRREAVLVGF